jgi:uncharacterized protein
MLLDSIFTELQERLMKMERVIIAYSGGVDSTLLLKAATLSDMKDILAVTGTSESLPEKELAFAIEMTSALNIRHKIIATEELKNEGYSSNPPERCYYCKKELFSKLKDIAAEENIPFILDGTNADDADDWRPGRRAAIEAGVMSPLLDAELDKRKIRDISRTLGLPTWDKPATPCLSSRFQYGRKITAEALKRVEMAEDFIRNFGIKDLRIRDHSEVARIEVTPDEFSALMNETARPQIIAYLKSLGYRYITLDLQGFRSGNGNETISGLYLEDSSGGDSGG